MLDTFQNIYKENYQTVYRVAQKLIRDEDTVADIIQEVFIYLHEKMEEGKVIQYPKSWLYRATYNKSIDYLKNKNRFQTIDTFEDCLEDENVLDESDLHKEIQCALSKLKAEEKFLVILYSEGLSYKELAEVTGIKFSSIGKTLSRALQKVQLELKNKHYELY
ncbi:hypothetical protein ALGA_3346 [Labilibaculum antarcticum]|uniref:RNA polymerase subunit sigma-24 n=1 Tax=Labilibaculum antarcticum TaxID=1717717 RepID=A0A1Y1CMZ0_9BACT|nr:hypothetical protein ALGA_3346 [Labilibaculum antarcticum]